MSTPTELRPGVRAAWGSPAGPKPAMRALDWRPHASGTLQGFFALQLPSGLRINDCTLHERDGRRWVGLPGKPQLDTDGRVLLDSATGKRTYTSVIEIPAKEVRDKFRDAALAAVDRMLAEGGGP